GAASFQCILRDFARGGRVRLLEGPMTHGWIQEFMKLPKAATRKNLLAGNSRHALLEELQQADLALRARGKICRPSFGRRSAMLMAIPEDHRLPETCPSIDQGLGSVILCFA